MPATTKWAASAAARRDRLQQLGAFWYHDGHPARPYARLASGLLSNGYFNGAVLSELPLEIDMAATALVGEFVDRGGSASRIDRVIAPEKGAITLGNSVGIALSDISGAHCRFSFAEKRLAVVDGKIVETGEFDFKRGPPRDDEVLLRVEDTVTTGGSVRATGNAALAVAPRAMFAKFLLALCNRTGTAILDGMEIIALVEGDFRTWKDGENPFTPDGQELVAPVAKVKQNWDVLTRPY